MHRAIGGQPDVDLDPVAVDLIRLVVEAKWGRGRIASDHYRLHHLHSQRERLIGPVHDHRRRKVIWPGIRFLAAAVLVLVIEPKRLGLLEALHAPVQRGGLGYVERRGMNHERPFPDEGLEWLGVPPGTSQTGRSGGRSDLPTFSGRQVSVHPVVRLDLYCIVRVTYSANYRVFQPRLQDCHYSKRLSPGTDEIERHQLLGPRSARAEG